MKTVITFLLGAVVAVGGTYLYHTFGMKTPETSYVLKLNIVDGQRVRLKDLNQLQNFEDLLKTIASEGTNGTNGTDVNIRPRDDDSSEIQGPTQNGSFDKPAFPIGPKRSAHSTQSVKSNDPKKLKDVLDFFEAGSAVTEEAVVPTESPSPTTPPSP